GQKRVADGDKDGNATLVSSLQKNLGAAASAAAAARKEAKEAKKKEKEKKKDEKIAALEAKVEQLYEFLLSPGGEDEEKEEGKEAEKQVDDAPMQE
ncbi:uncharacterized protein FSUBG_2768, partial [Fusarium subglutinans]